MTEKLSPVADHMELLLAAGQRVPPGTYKVERTIRIPPEVKS